MAWLVTVVPTLNWPDLRRELLMPAGGLPVLLVVLGVLGTLWADVTWLERWKGLDSFFKLLVIPLLLVQFRRSDRGLCVFAAYLIACTLLLLLSSMFYLAPSTRFLFTPDIAVPVKNASSQMYSSSRVMRRSTSSAFSSVVTAKPLSPMRATNS